jgi:leader peptidase (prepilin peptidase)/N-methyltransferase
LEEFTQAYFLFALFVFGLLCGSLANVIIWRFPRGESFVSPGSHCPSCGHAIRWYDNIPLVSWVVLRGRCRDCGTSISARYPAVELLSGLLWLAAGLAFGVSGTTVFAIVFFYLLLVLAFIDIDTQRLPNPIVLALAVVGLAGAAGSQILGVRFCPLVGVAVQGLLAEPLAAALLGAALGGGVTLGIALLYRSVRGLDGLGMGDVKLMAAMGLYVGTFSLLALALGSLLGTLVAIPMMRKGAGARTRIPFGPFLAVGGVLSVLLGPGLWAWYASVIGIT